MKRSLDIEEAIRTVEMLLDAECLVVSQMEADGVEDIDRRVLNAYAISLVALKKIGRSKENAK